MITVHLLIRAFWIGFVAFISLTPLTRAHAPKVEKSRASINCEELENQFDFYRRLAMQDKEALQKDLKKRNNQKSHQQKAIQLQLKEMDHAQKKARQLHKKLEKYCGEETPF